MSDRYDLAVIVALPEEFGYLHELLTAPSHLSANGHDYFGFGVGPRRAICSQIGRMGLLGAVVAVIDVLLHFDVATVVLLGLAGSLSTDVRLGDVVVASAIDHYSYAAKIRDDANGSLIGESAFGFAGQVWQVPMSLQNAVNTLRFSSPKLYDTWSSQCRKRFKNLALDSMAVAGEETLPLYHATPQLHLGPIASGDFVVTSKAFRQSLVQHNRQFVAVEMEAAGAATAIESQGHGQGLVVVRGISDFADPEKGAIDEGRPFGAAKDAWRKYAFQNAYDFLVALVSSESYAPIAPPPQYQLAREDDSTILRKEVVVRTPTYPATDGNVVLSPMLGDPKTDLSARLIDRLTRRLRIMPAHRDVRHVAVRAMAASLELGTAIIEELLDEAVSRRRFISDGPFVQLPIEYWQPTRSHDG
ncbi:MAG: 5'-methylthioadenosine/S-adenosylhomocysteine nucleosidase family protein [Candidatus Dormibacteria bacterium]